MLLKLILFIYFEQIKENKKTNFDIKLNTVEQDYKKLVKRNGTCATEVCVFCFKIEGWNEVGGVCICGTTIRGFG